MVQNMVQCIHGTLYHLHNTGYQIQTSPAHWWAGVVQYMLCTRCKIGAVQLVHSGPCVGTWSAMGFGHPHSIWHTPHATWHYFIGCFVYMHLVVGIGPHELWWHVFQSPTQCTILLQGVNKIYIVHCKCKYFKLVLVSDYSIVGVAR